MTPSGHRRRVRPVGDAAHTACEEHIQVGIATHTARDRLAQPAPTCARSANCPHRSRRRTQDPRRAPCCAPARSCSPFGAADRKMLPPDNIERLRTSHTFASRGNIRRTSTRRTECPRSRVSHRSSSKNRKSERNPEKIGLIPAFSCCSFHGPSGEARMPRTRPANAHAGRIAAHRTREEHDQVGIATHTPATSPHSRCLRVHRRRRARPGEHPAHPRSRFPRKDRGDAHTAREEPVRQEMPCSRSTALSEVLRSVLALRSPMINAQGKP